MEEKRNIEDGGIKDFRAISLKDYAIVLGNGVNLWACPCSISWDTMAEQTRQALAPHVPAAALQNMTNPEKFDYILANAENTFYGKNLRNHVASCYRNKLDLSGVQAMQDFAQALQKIGAPVLTTNYDCSIEKALSLQSSWYKSNQKHNYRYPFDRYYSDSPISDHVNDFALWHIHGEFGQIAKSSRTSIQDSIRLTTTEYIELAKEIHDIVYDMYGNQLVMLQNPSAWKGKDTWIEILFNRPLLVLGWGAGKDEFVLRWLLLWRYGCCKKYGAPQFDDVYVCCSKEPDYLAKVDFFSSIGFHVIVTQDYSDAYSWIIAQAAAMP